MYVILESTKVRLLKLNWNFLKILEIPYKLASKLFNRPKNSSLISKFQYKRNRAKKLLSSILEIQYLDMFNYSPRYYFCYELGILIKIMYVYFYYFLLVKV
jgi:hypothetical protein